LSEARYPKLETGLDEVTELAPSSATIPKDCRDMVAKNRAKAQKFDIFKIILNPAKILIQGDI
jgi:hypothetical protein